MTTPMILKETYGDEKEINIETGSIDIIAEDGRDLFSIKLNDDGAIEISTSAVCKFNGVMLDTAVSIIPKHSNLIIVERKKI
jgi:hypothetical protein